MKKIFLAGVALFIMAASATAVERIVFVELEHVFNEFYKTQLAKAKLEVQRQDIEDERQLMVNEMTAMGEEVDTFKKEARDITLSQEIRDGKRILYEERLLELRDKEKEIVDFTQRRGQQLQLQVTRMSQTIMDEIQQAAVEYAKQEGMLAVIDSSKRGSVMGVFIYTHPDVDITEAMLVMLNSKRPDVLEEDDGSSDDTVTEPVEENVQEGAEEE